MWLTLRQSPKGQQGAEVRIKELHAKLTTPLWKRLFYNKPSPKSELRATTKKLSTQDIPRLVLGGTLNSQTTTLNACICGRYGSELRRLAWWLELYSRRFTLKAFDGKKPIEIY